MNCIELGTEVKNMRTNKWPLALALRSLITLVRAVFGEVMVALIKLYCIWVWE